MQDSLSSQGPVASSQKKLKHSSRFSCFFLVPGYWLLATFFLATGYWTLATGFCAENPSPFAADKLVNHEAPDFTLKDVNGRAFSLGAHRGTVVLLNFWATWCPPCREEMPSMNELSRQLKNRKFLIIAVSTDRAVADVKTFLKKNHTEFPVLVDRDFTVSKSLYKVFMMPTSFLIDKRGVIMEKFYGEEDWTDPELVGKIESLL